MSAHSLLRLYQDDSPHPHAIRLEQAFEEFLLPQLVREKRSPGHIAQFRTLIRHWRLLTEDPPIVKIDDACLQAFYDALLAHHHSLGQRGNENVHKAKRYLRSIFRACARRGDSNKRGQTGGKHLLEDLPNALPPQHDKQKKRVADLEDIGRAYEACDIATWPRSKHRSLWDGPVALWRLLYVLDYNYGPRTEELLKLRWEAIYWDPPCPAPEISRLEWRFGWLVYTPPKTRQHKPEPLHLPLTECVRLHLDAMRPCAKPTGPIFAFPKNKRGLHDTRKAIWRRAGIEHPYTFQELRKTCSTNWNDLFPQLGELVTGHAKRSVNQIHYDSELRRLCKYAPHLPQPTAFLKGVGLDVQRASAKEELAQRIGTFSEEQASLILKLADNMAS